MNYRVINKNGLFIMSVGLNEYAFTFHESEAIKFFTEENASKFIRMRNGTLGSLSVKELE